MSLQFTYAVAKGLKAAFLWTTRHAPVDDPTGDAGDNTGPAVRSLSVAPQLLLAALWSKLLR